MSKCMITFGYEKGMLSNSEREKTMEKHYRVITRSAVEPNTTFCSKKVDSVEFATHLVDILKVPRTGWDQLQLMEYFGPKYPLISGDNYKGTTTIEEVKNIPFF